jgi:hypothetical protein
MNDIYHSDNVKLTTTGHSPLNGGAAISLFDDGQVVLAIHAANRSLSVSLHIDADSLRAFAKLLNDAVDALKVEDAANV